MGRRGCVFPRPGHATYTSHIKAENCNCSGEKKTKKWLPGDDFMNFHTWILFSPGAWPFGSWQLSSIINSGHCEYIPSLSPPEEFSFSNSLRRRRVSLTSRGGGRSMHGESVAVEWERFFNASSLSPLIGRSVEFRKGFKRVNAFENFGHSLEGSFSCQKWL